MGTFEDVRVELTNRLDELLKRQTSVERDLRRPQDPDSEERAQQAENDEVLADLEVRGRHEVAQIRLALSQIEAGTYGTCSVCGGSISAERLVALPFTSTCIGCASR
jgi:RNA polymerase-binding transcription factor DksA